MRVHSKEFKLIMSFTITLFPQMRVLFIQISSTLGIFGIHFVYTRCRSSVLGNFLVYTS